MNQKGYIMARCILTKFGNGTDSFPFKISNSFVSYKLPVLSSLITRRPFHLLNQWNLQSPSNSKNASENLGVEAHDNISQPRPQGQPDFHNLLSDENKIRAQKNLTVAEPYFSSWPLKPDYSYAAVLVPLCTVNNTPSMLFTLRSTRLKKHRGQVSFPGGNMDHTDTGVIHTALRETQEELGMDPDRFDIWGQLTPLPGSDGQMLVYPILVKTGEVTISELQLSHSEVEQVFSVPLEHFCHPGNLGRTRFSEGYTLPVFANTTHRIWGLTAIIVHQTMGIIAPNLYHHKVLHRGNLFGKKDRRHRHA